MRYHRQWKKTGALLAAAAVICSGSLLSGNGSLTAFAKTQQKSFLTEYDEAALESFKDNTLEYWEIPGLIQEYNPEFKSRQASFEYAPDSSIGLTKEQLLSIAAGLRTEAEELKKTAEEDKDGLSKKEYDNSLANVRVLKAKAQELEDAAKGRSASGAASIRSMRLLKEQLIKEAREQMKNTKLLKKEEEIARNGVRIAELSLNSAKLKKELGLYAKEQELDAKRSLDSAKAAEASAASAYQDARQSLILLCGWSYDAKPVIGEIPKPDTSVISGFNPETDAAKAIENNMCIFDTRMTASAQQGGADAKARTLKTQENEVRSKLSFLYQSVLQKKAAYDAAEIKFDVNRSEKEAAERKNALGMLSEAEYLQAENDWLLANKTMDQAVYELTSAIEEYEWALKGLLQLDTTVQTSQTSMQ